MLPFSATLIRPDAGLYTNLCVNTLDLECDALIYKS